MRVLIKDVVFERVDAFYMKAIDLHPTLDVRVVLAKEQRLYSALKSLGSTYFLYSPPRYIRKWQEAGYLDFICEDFHFAFCITELPDGEVIISVEDARHSLLFHD